MGGKKAFSICSMSKGGLSPISVMMSNLTGRSISNRLRYESVDDTIWRILRSVTASCGWPYLSFLLVLTSITMSVWSFSATMSRSFFPSCQSVCLMRYPFSAGKKLPLFRLPFRVHYVLPYFSFRQNTYFCAMNQKDDLFYMKQALLEAGGQPIAEKCRWELLWSAVVSFWPERIT